MMKKYKLMPMLAALFMLIPAFVSCDKDDDDEPVEVSPVVGSYSGSMTCDVVAQMGGQAQTWNNLEITGEKEIRIIKNDKTPGRVTVVIPECSYMPPMGQTLQTIPSLTVENVEVEELSDGSYSLDLDDYEVAVGDVQYTVNIEDYDKDDRTGTVIKGANIDLVYTVTPGKMPGLITFYFSGIKK